MSSLTEAISATGEAGFQQIGEIISQVDENPVLQGLGVMLYYADTKLESELEESKVAEEPTPMANEAHSMQNLLLHCIIGLCSVQHNGSMVIKLHETHDLLTVGVLFMIYSMFQKVCIVKPYATSFFDSRQYLICTGLKQRKPQGIITKLLRMYANLKQDPTLRLVHC